MSSGAQLPMADATIAPSLHTEHRAVVLRFLSLAVRGLGPMFDEQRQLFCYKLKRTDDGMIQDGLSERYTMMTLMGLHRFERSGGTSPFDSQRILASLLSTLSWVD